MIKETHINITVEDFSLHVRSVSATQVRIYCSRHSVKVELKASTMSSSSSYPTEMVPNSSDNSAAVETDSKIDGGYADINDTALPRKRRLPMPPALKPQRPKKNLTLCCKPCKELCSYCVGSRLILSIPLLVLTLVALGAFIYLLVTNIPVPDPPPTVITPPDPRDVDGIPEGSSGTLTFKMSSVQKPEVLNLLQESTGQNLTIMQNVKLNFTNGTWSFDEREISIEISDKGYFRIVIHMKISNSQCRHAGTYFVLLSGNNHKSAQSLLYKVKAGCPCESEYELNFDKELKCEWKVIGNTTIRFNKVSGENKKLILYQTGIHIPDNVPERSRFSAVWNRSGTLTTRIKFSPVRCPDEGNYSLTVASRKGTQLQYMYIKVIDHPVEPTISILEGLVDGKENVLQCQASTGCKNASLIVESTQQKGNDYITWSSNLTTVYYQEGSIWKANTSLILTKYIVNPNIIQNKCFRCSYAIGGKAYYSKPICIKIIPADFCTNRIPKCQYPHPYDCNKYITCAPGPVESNCQAGLHYHWNLDNCTGECLYPGIANCNIQQFDGCDCEDI